MALQPLEPVPLPEQILRRAVLEQQRHGHAVILPLVQQVGRGQLVEFDLLCLFQVLRFCCSN
jgi:hypothetical protein